MNRLLFTDGDLDVYDTELDDNGDPRSFQGRPMLVGGFSDPEFGPGWMLWTDEDDHFIPGNESERGYAIKNALDYLNMSQPLDADGNWRQPPGTALTEAIDELGQDTSWGELAARAWEIEALEESGADS